MLASLIRRSSISRCLFFTGIFSRAVVCVPTTSTQLSVCSRATFLPAIIGSSLSSRLLCSLVGNPPSEEDSDRMTDAVAHGNPEIVASKGQHKATVIFFHGLGDQGHGWADAFKNECRPDHIKFICPHSADRSVTLNMGMSMPAWFDLYGLDASAREDASGLAAATRYAHSLIDAEIKAGVPANKICIGGFSMGGALAIYAGLTYPQRLGGIIGMSTFFMQRNQFPAACTANRDTPIFMGHGTMDPLVPIPIGQLSQSVIKQFNPNIDFHTYPMGHSSCADELRDLKQFLSAKLV